MSWGPLSLAGWLACVQPDADVAAKIKSTVGSPQAHLKRSPFGKQCVGEGCAIACRPTRPLSDNSHRPGCGLTVASPRFQPEHSARSVDPYRVISLQSSSPSSSLVRYRAPRCLATINLVALLSSVLPMLPVVSFGLVALYPSRRVSLDRFSSPKRP